MGDPAFKSPLDPREVARLASTLDLRFHVARTPGLKPIPFEVLLILAGLSIVIFTPIYIHLDVTPFLPFEVNNEVTKKYLAIFSLILAAGGALFLLSMAAIFATMYIGRLRPKKVTITCHSCGAKIKPEKYLELHQCPNCESSKVYCAKCGMTSQFAFFVSGDGCQHCGHQYIAVSR